MKLKFLFMLIISIILFVSSNIFAQSVSKIYFKNGNMIKGEIIKTIEGEKIKVKLSNGSIINYQLNEINKIDTIPLCKKGSLGLGQRWMWGDKKQHGLDLDLQFLLTSSAYERVKEREDMYGRGIADDRIPFALSVGYRYGF